MHSLTNYLLNLCSVATGRQPVRPLLFSYYVTHRCELACTYCCDGRGKPFKETQVPELDTADAKQLIAILARSAGTLDFTGGEPLVRDDLEELLAHARDCGMQTVVNTKAMGLEHRPDLLRYCDMLVISLDSLDADVCGRLWGCDRNAAARSMAGLEYAMKSRRQGQAIVLSTVATPSNLTDAAGVLDFASEHRLGFHISPELIGTTANPALRSNPKYENLIARAEASKRAGTHVLGISAYLSGIRSFRPFRCHPLLMPTIRADGRLYYPCLESCRADVNILETGSYPAALRAARGQQGGIPDCQDKCHIFCHMALSLLQRNPISALMEGRQMARIGGDSS